MTGWLLIVSLLILGGILSTLGDQLGSRVGKARLSIFNLRPRRTAVVITVLTGSLISAISFGFMLLVSRQLRVGLFELDDLQSKLKVSRLALQPLQKERKILETKINVKEKELKNLEKNLIAFRRGSVVISSGQPLVTATINANKKVDTKKIIESLLQKANVNSYKLVRPGEIPNKRLILVPKADINRLEEIIEGDGSWVVSIRSAANVLKGEKYVYVFPEIRRNKNIVRKGEVISSTIIQSNELDSDSIRKKVKLLLASTFAEIKRRGSLSSELQIDANTMNNLGQALRNHKGGEIQLETLAINDSDTADQVAVLLQIKETLILKSQ